MWTAVFEFTIAPANRAAFRVDWEEFAAIRERQTGFCGSIEVDAGEGRLIGLVLWESYRAHEAAYSSADAAAMQGAFDRAFALMATPTKGIAAGEVFEDSLSGAGPWERLPELALVNEVVIAPGQRAAYDAANRERLAMRALQPGFCGSIELDADEGRIAWLAVWTNRDAFQAAGEALRPIVDRAHIHVQSSGRIGAGAIVRNTITRRTAPA